MVACLALAVALLSYVVGGRSRDVPPSAVSAPAASTPGDEPRQDSGAGSFLDAFAAKEEVSEPKGAVLDDAALEKRFGALLALEDRLRQLAEQASVRQSEVSKKELEQALKRQEDLLAGFNQEVAAFEKEVGRARKDRPHAAIPAWLTGELLLLIHGEPEEILPHLERARAAGLEHPRLDTSLARAQVEANRFEDAFRSAASALDIAAQNRQAWDVFTRIAFNTQRFADVIARIDKSFPGAKPAWAAEIGSEAAARLVDWQAEANRRRTEARADNLPRVRLVIEHRRFARDERGVATTKIESTGKGEVVIELFEDQAPAAVANFLTLAADKKYDGTRFYLAEAATLVAGGDVQSRTGDPKDDGRGNPGYFIADEFERPDARGHYRGSLSLVNSGPGTSGSQFFITLVPMPEMDGQFTVFGRVLQGQDVVDRITRGRTHPDVGGRPQGRIIPGDLLVRAEVLRKRDHEYRLIKAP